MSRAVIFFSVMLCGHLVSGCSANWFSKGTYDALQTQNQMRSTPAEQLGRPVPPNYDEYQRLRREQSLPR